VPIPNTRHICGCVSCNSYYEHTATRLWSPCSRGLCAAACCTWQSSAAGWPAYAYVCKPESTIPHRILPPHAHPNNRRMVQMTSVRKDHHITCLVASGSLGASSSRNLGNLRRASSLSRALLIYMTPIAHGKHRSTGWCIARYTRLSSTPPPASPRLGRKHVGPALGQETERDLPSLQLFWLFGLTKVWLKWQACQTPDWDPSIHATIVMCPPCQKAPQIASHASVTQGCWLLWRHTCGASRNPSTPKTTPPVTNPATKLDSLLRPLALHHMKKQAARCSMMSITQRAELGFVINAIHKHELHLLLMRIPELGPSCHTLHACQPGMAVVPCQVQGLFWGEQQISQQPPKHTKVCHP